MVRSVVSQVLVFAAALSVPASGVLAQPTGQDPLQPDSTITDAPPRQIAVRGEISGGGSSPNSWTIELRPYSGGSPQSAIPRQDGAFEFYGVTPGQYRLSVSDEKGRILHEETVSLRLEAERLYITVPGEPTHAAGPATVSVGQLRHKVPGKAMSEFRKGTAELKKRQLPSAVDHLKTAVALDPEFAEAHNDLGFAYVRLKEYPQSLQEFQTALALAPNQPMANDNLCLVLIELKRFAEAGQVAERVLKHGSDSAIAHYSLALSLLAQGGSRNQALDQLRRAEDRMPTARLLAASVLEGSGRRSDAAKELRDYLGSETADSQRPAVEAWLARLKE